MTELLILAWVVLCLLLSWTIYLKGQLERELQRHEDRLGTLVQVVQLHTDRMNELERKLMGLGSIVDRLKRQGMATETVMTAIEKQAEHCYDRHDGLEKRVMNMAQNISDRLKRLEERTGLSQ